MRRVRTGGAASPVVVVALLLAAVVVGAGALLAARGSTGPGPATPAPTRASLDDLTLRVEGRGRLDADGDTLVLVVPVAADVAGAVTLGRPTGLPPGLHALDAQTRIPAGGTGSLRLGWDGPDCTRDVPDRVLPDVTLPVTVAGRTVQTRLDTSGADRLLRQTWVSGCGIQPTPPQGH
ncbi:MAG TPA: hypothetical protein VFS29_02660 [Motilibacteraceae bacterium]|nr:hypothetical protein [Motilibacteraceae bacterium]